MPRPSLHAPINDDDAHYLALKARDARFDGRFFTGVTSTGIYCRPVCKVRTPKRENCQFFTLTALAEQAGFRPCLRCRPELAPAGSAMSDGVWSTQDASRILAQQAARLLDASLHSPDGAAPGVASASALAERLGLSERHTRRIFEAHWGVTPLQYLQTRRLLAAKQWLTDTPLSVIQIAQLSGFASVRRFNAAIVEHYRLQPTALRKAASGQAVSTRLADEGILLKASYRPPYDVGAVLGFFAQRALASVEMVDVQGRVLARTLSVPYQGGALHGWVRCQFVPERHGVDLRISTTLAPVLPLVLARVRALLDLDADPMAINACLGNRFPGMDGLRVPGTLDGFELAVRAVLGQQVTVAAGRTLTQRLVQRFGTELTTPWPQLSRAFPSAEKLAMATGEDLGALGVVRQRQQAILGLAQAVAQGKIRLTPDADIAGTVSALQALPGIGAWTANYIAMRALRWPDALVAGDVALHNALGLRGPGAAQVLTPKLLAQETERLAAAWRPFRSYAVIRAWHTLAPHYVAPTSAAPTYLAPSKASP